MFSVDLTKEVVNSPPSQQIYVRHVPRAGNSFLIKENRCIIPPTSNKKGIANIHNRSHHWGDGYLGA
jgi:hypothetical protein